MPSGLTAMIDRIVTYNGDQQQAVAGDAVVLTLTDEVDISRGDVISGAAALPGIADQFNVNIV